ncbi:selenium metabolism-associated LysR family transcriptional regulator [Bacillus massiliglaciei]|uniref:selenium metabolism-associated LysR family transcriptional regulator n=1 Tax=Bacillus massiliglaciei TaxID=1816693 RepID=UPI000DA6059A|nr:selenium metabolism-associated LysR family transcriptional regulator [Bacillus massiliglaciei]
MSIDSLRVFVTVVEQKHFSRAAEILNMSQPGVSLQIRNLEKEWNTKLILRSPKQVQVTEEGKILYRHAKQILNLYNEAHREINDMHNFVSGSLKIGASFTIGEYLLPKVLGPYATKYPMVDIQIIISNTEEVVKAIRKNEVDIGLIEGETAFPDIHTNSFMEDEMILIVPPDHPLSQSELADERMLQDQTWILREQGSGTRAYSDKLLNKLQIKTKRNFIFSSTQGVKEAVMEGLGIALLSGLSVQKEIKSGEVKGVRINNIRLKRPLYIVSRNETSISKAGEVFINNLIKVTSK